MKEKVVYIEVQSDEALDLTEDIFCLLHARKLLKKVRFIDKDRLYPVLNEIDSFERETRCHLRNKHLSGPTKPVSEALRERLRDELRKEVPLYGYEIPASSAGKDEADHANDRSDCKRPEKH